MTDDPTKRVIVAGDMTVDWNLVRFRATSQGRQPWYTEDQIIACQQMGGAALLAQLLQEVASELPESYQIWSQFPVIPGDQQFHQNYIIWDRYDCRVSTSQNKENQVWRVTQFLGVERAWDLKPQAMEEVSEAALVILDDANLGYREEKNAWAWPKVLAPGGCRPWIILKMSSPVLQGALWEHLYQHYADRLMVILTVNDLRRSEVQVSRELSWESSALDLIREINQNPRIDGLSRCAYVVVSFDLAGALLMEGQGGAAGYRLFFDPNGLEGMWEQSYPGQVPGGAACLAAGIARELLVSPDRPVLGRGIETGLRAMRVLHQAGYEEDKSGPSFSLTFPFRRITQELSQEPAGFPVSIEIPAPAAAQPAWTILQERYTGSLERLVQNIVRFGIEPVLKTVPLGHFGELTLVDRWEIEGFRNIHNLMKEYCFNQQSTLPLSLAVFGPPGSGKSFGVTQIARSVLSGNLEVKVFNLSQFRGPEELAGAFHQVRDISLRGKLPLVFWDEFDTALGESLGWLKYFLSPMQDGTFQEGQITHPIGRAIFVFAGGTCETMSKFGKKMDQNNFSAAKGPDFVSRLKGYVNILGPDHRWPLPGTSAGADPFYLIRRAMLLRSLLTRHWANLSLKNADGSLEIKIDPGVLRAFLFTKEYKHGARSMEAMVTNSRLAGKTEFARSALPPKDQMEIHVQEDNFLELVGQPTLPDDQIEPLAELAHQIYLECYPETSWPAHYRELPEEFKDSNRGFVRNIPIKLAHLGYAMRPRIETDPPFEFSELQIEALSEMEHGRWLDEKMAFGWRYGPTRDNFEKIHPDLLPWKPMTPREIASLDPLKATAFKNAAGKALPDEEKEKDRCLVRNIPRVLHEAGYAIVAIRK